MRTVEDEEVHQHRREPTAMDTLKLLANVALRFTLCWGPLAVFAAYISTEPLAASAGCIAAVAVVPQVSAVLDGLRKLCGRPPLNESIAQWLA